MEQYQERKLSETEKSWIEYIASEQNHGMTQVFKSPKKYFSGDITLQELKLINTLAGEFTFGAQEKEEIYSDVSIIHLSTPRLDVPRSSSYLIKQALAISLASYFFRGREEYRERANIKRNNNVEIRTNMQDHANYNQASLEDLLFKINEFDRLILLKYIENIQGNTDDLGLLAKRMNMPLPYIKSRVRKIKRKLRSGDYT